MSPTRKEPDTSTYCGRFAVRLRELREEAELSIEELAEQIAKHNDSGRKSPGARAIYQWEQAKSMPPFELLPVIATSLCLKSPRKLIPQN